MSKLSKLKQQLEQWEKEGYDVSALKAKWRKELYGGRFTRNPLAISSIVIGFVITLAIGIGLGVYFVRDQVSISSPTPTQTYTVIPTTTATLTHTSTPTITVAPTPTPVKTTSPTGYVTVSIDAPNAVNKSAGRYFHAYVTISPVSNFYAATYDITYDPDVIRVQDVTPGDISGTTIRIEKWSYVPANTQGTLRIVNGLPTSIGMNGIGGDGYLADIYFKVMGDPGDFSAISFIEGEGDPAGYLMIASNQGTEITATWVDSTVTIE